MPAAQHAALENLESTLAWSKELGDHARAPQIRAAATAALGLAPLPFEAAFARYLSVASVPKRENGAAGYPNAALLGMPPWQGTGLAGNDTSYFRNGVLTPHARRAEVKALRGRQVTIDNGALAHVHPGYFGAKDDKTDISLVADARGSLFRGDSTVLGERALAAASVRLGRGRRIAAVTGFGVGAYKATEVHAAAALLMLAANGLDLKRVKLDAPWFAGDFKGSARDYLEHLQPKLLADRTAPREVREAVRLAVGSYLTSSPTAPIVRPSEPLPYVPVVADEPKPHARFPRDVMAWLNARAAAIGAVIRVPVEPYLQLLGNADTLWQPAIARELLREAGLKSFGVDVLMGLTDVLTHCPQGGEMVDALLKRAQTGELPHASAAVPFEAIVRFERVFLEDAFRTQMHKHADAAKIPLKERAAVLDAFERAYVGTTRTLLDTIGRHGVAAQPALANALVDQLKRELAELQVSDAATATLVGFLGVGPSEGSIRAHVGAAVSLLGDPAWGTPLAHHVHRDARRMSSTAPLTDAERQAQAAPQRDGAFLPHPELTQRDGARGGSIVLAQDASYVAYRSLHTDSAVLPGAQAVASINIDLDAAGRPVKLNESSAKYDVPAHRTALLMLQMLADGFEIADVPVTAYTRPHFEFMQAATPYGSFSVRDYLDITAQQLATPRTIEESLVAQVLMRRGDLMPAKPTRSKA